MRIEVPIEAAVPIIALGAELKNTVCVLEGRAATLGPVFGNLGDGDSYRRFVGYVDEVVTRFAGRRFVVAHDLHPAFVSTELARRLSGQTVKIQHHHAHVASCLAENGVSGPVIGICCDGTGYGTDGAIWGGEVLYCAGGEFRRCAHLAYFALPGGDAAARQTWRPALSLVRQAFGEDVPADVRSLFAGVPPRALRVVEGMLTREFNCPRTSSLGRLFDAAAFLTGVCAHNDAEGMAAVRFEAAAAQVADQNPYAYRLLDTAEATAIDMTPAIRGLCADVGDGVAVEVIARRFHETVADALARAALRVREEPLSDGHGAKQGSGRQCPPDRFGFDSPTAKAMGHPIGRGSDRGPLPDGRGSEKTGRRRSRVVKTAALSGGCFVNRVLSARVEAKLSAGGFERVLTHGKVSCGDAGLSLGQAVVAADNVQRIN